MGRKERKAEQERLLNYSLEEDIENQENGLETREKIRTVLFFVCIAVAILSLVFTKWILFIVSVFAIIISVPFKFIVKIFPDNLKVYDFFFPHYYPDDHNVEIINNENINSKNFIKKRKAKKEIIENREELRREVNSVYGNINIIQLFSLIFVAGFLFTSFGIFMSEFEGSTPDETTTSFVTTTETTNNSTTTTTTTTAEITTETTTEATTKKEIYLYIEDDYEEIWLDIDDNRTVYLHHYEDDILDDDLEISPVIEKQGIVSIESDGTTYSGDYGFKITAKKAGKTKIIFKTNKNNYKTDSVLVHVKKPETTTKDTSSTVYVTPSGECYHFSSSCGGKNSYSITLNEAQGRGYRPCSKCAS